MTLGSRATWGAAWLVCAAPALASAQLSPTGAGDERPPFRLSASLDGGFSRVHYEDYLPSGVLGLSPAVRLDMPNAVLQARGSFSRFESGSFNTQGSLAGGLFTPARRRLRGEIGGFVSLGHHQGIGGSGTAQGILRVHLAGTDVGAWGSVGSGWSALGGGIGEGILFGDVGGWWRSGDLRMTGTVRFAEVDDVAYSDIEAAVRWDRSRLELGVEGGVRSGFFESLERNTGTRVNAGVWAGTEAAYWVDSRVAVVASIGKFLADPAANTIGGRYASLALRWASRPARREELPRVLVPRVLRGGTPTDENGVSAERLVIREGAGRAVILQLTLPGAESAELMGDFTDWEPLPLTRAGQDLWEVALVLDEGVHRVNFRTNGGEWRVPPSLTAVPDGFGGRVGLLVVRR